MPEVDMSEIVNDGFAAQAFTLTRTPGVWSIGEQGAGFQGEPYTVPMWGVIQPATAEDAEVLPEGDRITGAMQFHSTAPIYHSAGSQTTPSLADIISWRGYTYRVVHVYPWEDFGYYRAIGVRQEGD